MSTLAGESLQQSEDFALTQSPSHLIHRAQQFAADCYAESAGRDALTQRQFAVLTAVAHQDGLTQTDLVKATGIDRSTLADLVTRMVKKDLVARQKSEHDGRANIVRLTASGRQHLEAMRPQVSQADKAILDALPKAKRAAFLDALQRLMNVMDGVEGVGRAADGLSAPDTSKTGKSDKKAKAGKSGKKAKAASAKKAKSGAGKSSKKKKAKAS